MEAKGYMGTAVADSADSRTPANYVGVACQSGPANGGVVRTAYNAWYRC